MYSSVKQVGQQATQCFAEFGNHMPLTRGIQAIEVLQTSMAGMGRYGDMAQMWVGIICRYEEATCRSKTNGLRREIIRADHVVD